MSTSLKSAIRRSRARKSTQSIDAVTSIMIDAAEIKIEDLFNDLVAEIKQMSKAELLRVAATIKKGEKGDKGDKGDAVKGDKGDKGDQGDSVEGPEGPKGDKGDKGDRGDSILGGKGDKGKDGDDISLNTLFEKINSKDKIEIASIKGLEQYLHNLQRSIRERTSGTKGKVIHGGGMGNWVHESFAVSSVTTLVTANARAAANGTAHILRYNGQVLAYGSQYTVSGKVYTFTFTLDDNSTVDLSYVRT